MPSFSWSDCVTISQNAANPGDFKVGFVQNALILTGLAVYANNVTWADTYNPPLPLDDADPNNKPWYDAPKTFGQDGLGNNVALLVTDDLPSTARPTLSGNNQIQSMQLADSFTIWIVVKFDKNGDRDRGATIRIWHVDWDIDYRATIQWNNGVPTPQIAQGGHAPAITADVSHLNQQGVPQPGAPRMVTCGPTAKEAMSIKK